MKTKIFVLSFLLQTIFSPNIYGEEKGINPSNLTKVKTQGQLLTYTEEGEYGFKALASIGGAYKSGSQFMGMVEADFVGGEYSSMRAQYFQVFNTGNELLTDLGMSFDYIRPKGIDMDLKAIGLIGRVVSPWEKVSFFPNVAYVQSDLMNNSYNGYQVNLYTSINIASNGSYLLPRIGYTDIDYSKYVNLDFVASIPITNNRRLWAITKAEKIINLEDTVNLDNSLRLSIGMNYFF